MIRNNWKYKALAMAVSLILLIYVNSERNPHTQKTYSVPVRTVGTARGYIAELDTPKVSVVIRGLKSLVDTVARDDVEAQVDLDKLAPNRKIVQASLPIEVRLPGTVASDLTVDPTPKSVHVRMEALEERKMPVEVSFTSDPPLGYSYSSPLLAPDTVTISGRASELARVSKAIVVVSSDQSGSSTDDYYDVMPIDAGGNTVADVSIRPNRVRAKLEMVEVPQTKAVMISPSFSGEPKFPYKVARYTVTPSTVILEGKPSALGGLSCIPTEKVVLEGADQTVTREVAMRVPPGVKAVRTKTVKVTVYIGTD